MQSFCNLPQTCTLTPYVLYCHGLQYQQLWTAVVLAMQAIEFVQMQRDDELWELLISLALESPALTGGAAPPFPCLPSPSLPCLLVLPLVLPCPALPSPPLACPALRCPALPCPALPHPALPCPPAPTCFALCCVLSLACCVLSLWLSAAADTSIGARLTRVCGQGFG